MDENTLLEFCYYLFIDNDYHLTNLVYLLQAWIIIVANNASENDTPMNQKRQYQH